MKADRIVGVTLSVLVKTPAGGTEPLTIAYPLPPAVCAGYSLREVLDLSVGACLSAAQDNLEIG